MIAPISMLVGPGNSKAMTVIWFLAGMVAVAAVIKQQKAATQTTV